MGCYIDPSDGSSKESFLAKWGKRVSQGEAIITEESLPVVLVDNIEFTAAGIAYDAAELKAFTQPDDYRPKTFYMVPRSVLTEFLLPVRHKYKSFTKGDCHDY